MSLEVEPTFEKLYVCTSCLETLYEAEAVLRFSPCCDALVSEQNLALRVEGVEDKVAFLEALNTSTKERHKVLAFIGKWPADSKKRRKMYAKPTGKDAWPGKLSHRGLTYKPERKSRKRAPTPKAESISLDIISDSGYTVEITGKYTHTIHAENKDKAKRKARAWLRGRETSIVNASSVIEEPSRTMIHYDGVTETKESGSDDHHKS